MKSVLVTVCVSLALVWQAGLAQTDETDAVPAEPTEQSETREESEPESASDDDPTSDDEVNPDASFTPTEEISEDKPVAFPVDI